jgi:biopolymer transport protein ExbD
MQFNSGDSGSNFQSEINITPLVDVVLVLLIIFMVVAPLLMEGYDVSIPRASADVVEAQAEEAQLILSVGPAACAILEPPTGDGLPADCRVTLADQAIPAAELPTRVAEILGPRPAEKRVLFLAADDRLNYEGVLRIVDLAKSGVQDLKIEFVATQ